MCLVWGYVKRSPVQGVTESPTFHPWEVTGMSYVSSQSPHPNYMGFHDCYLLLCFKVEKKCRETNSSLGLSSWLSVSSAIGESSFPNFFSLQLWRSRGIRAVLSHTGVRNVFRGHLCIFPGRMEGLTSSGGGREGCQLLCGKRNWGRRKREGFLCIDSCFYTQTGTVLNPPVFLLPVPS